MTSIVSEIKEMVLQPFRVPYIPVFLQLLHFNWNFIAKAALRSIEKPSVFVPRRFYVTVRTKSPVCVWVFMVHITFSTNALAKCQRFNWQIKCKCVAENGMCKSEMGN